MKLISLDENVLRALDFFTKNKPPIFDVNKFVLPFVVGSGNAYNTGLILFSEKAAIFADESNFRKFIESFNKVIREGLIKEAIIISASGGKDSVWEIDLSKKHNLHTSLLTTKKDSDAAKIADEVFVFQSISEPYTYNVSTYMGMVLSKTKEDPLKIKDFIKSINFPNNFEKYTSYSFIVPDKFMHICPMLDIKKSELFGPYLSLRAFSVGHARHAKFVIRSKEELVISIGVKNDYFGDLNHRWQIEPPSDIDYAGIMAISYYIVGKIQNSKPQFFKENIEKYVTDYGPKAYGSLKPFDLIVPGTSG